MMVGWLGEMVRGEMFMFLWGRDANSVVVDDEDQHTHLINATNTHMALYLSMMVYVNKPFEYHSQDVFMAL